MKNIVFEMKALAMADLSEIYYEWKDFQIFGWKPKNISLNPSTASFHRLQLILKMVNMSVRECVVVI
jgi:hypothetical protein